MRYHEQFERMKRLFLKINPISEDHGEQKEYEDNLYCFFIIAWSLKEWIKNDSDIECEHGIETVFNSYESLRICADLANGFKHLKLDRNSREDAKFCGNDVTIYLSTPIIEYTDGINGKIGKGKVNKVTYNYYVSDKSCSKYQTTELAKQIIKDWNEIIDNNLKPNNR